MKLMKNSFSLTGLTTLKLLIDLAPKPFFLQPEVQERLTT